MDLLQRIDHWAAVAPDALAHVSGDWRLTYGELKSRSDALASEFVARCGTNKSPIVVIGHREPEMLIAFLGAAKSGHPYVPIDTIFPKARVEQIAKIAKPAMVVRPEEIKGLSSAAPARAPELRLETDAPFYILFTSGSSGEPKGVIVSARSLEHFVSWMLGEQKFTERGEVFLNQAPFSFDLSVMDLYCSLASGGTLFSVSRDLVEDPKSMYRALARSGITTWVSTPSFAQMCAIERTLNADLLPNVRRFLFCGETLLPQTVQTLLERFPLAEIWNTYGPTEATVATTSIRIDREILQRYSVLPVGRAMPGTDVFLTNENKNTTEEGESGEIVIAGPNVSSGYLSRPDLTANSFFDRNGKRAYRTGDHGRFQDGLLFFEGRIDGQIKLNGYRIELGDIAANLRAVPLVHDAAVVPVMRDGKVQSLTAFVVVEKSGSTGHRELTAALREQLRRRVPSYMMPRKFVFKDTFPITPNGKLDLRKLAESL